PGDQWWPDGAPAFLRRRWIARANRNVLGALVNRDLRLAQVVSGAANQPPVKARELTDDVRRQVILAQVHAVSIGGDRNVGVIIDDEERTVDMGQPAKCQRDGVLLALGHRLLS